MRTFQTLWAWTTFTTVSCAIFVYMIMFPTFSDSLNTLDPLWGEGQPLDVMFYLSTRSQWAEATDFNTGAVHIGSFKSLTFTWESSNYRHLDLNISHAVLKHLTNDSSTADQVWNTLKGNASVYMHVHVTHAGFSPNPKHSTLYDQYRTIHQSSSLVKYAPRPNVKNTSLLLAPVAPSSTSQPKAHCEALTISYWKPAENVRLVTDFTRYPVEEIPVMVYHNLRYVQHPMDQRWRYLPALYVDDMSLTQDELVPLNGTLDDGSGGEAVLPLRLSWSPLSFARWQMQLTFATVLLSQEQIGVPASDLEALRSMVADTHPVLLAVTMSVSLLHLLFDWLAFRHDVSYWRAKGEDVVGVSLRAMAAELGSQCVVLLYLVDQDSTLLVTGPQVISVVLLIWKVTKVWRAQRRQLGSTAKCKGTKDSAKKIDKHSLRLLQETQRADSLATSHMFFVLAPLAVGYAVYSLMYVPHAGWYAWLLESLTTTVYGLGFAFMLPQLVINYRLKSVAHLQWRLLVYRALNTFIDDLFAFVIKMPTLHRISCFRDDIVFIVYLYQRWTYPVDAQRLEDVADSGSTSEGVSSSKPHNE